MKMIIVFTDNGILPHYDIRIETNDPAKTLDAIDIIKNIKKQMRKLCME